jgi:hypothetical protein
LVVIRISAKIDSTKIIWIRITTVTARDMCGTMMWRNREKALAPSISDASSCSRSSDCSAVSRIKVAKGSHCDATIRMMENSGAAPGKSNGANPTALASWADNPLTRFRNMFFHISADTVGITKNGAMIRMRVTPWPQIGWSNANPPIFNGVHL